MRWTVGSLITGKGTRTTLDVLLDGLSDDAAEEAQALVETLEKHGNNLRMPISKSLKNGLFEARGLTTGIRLFFVFAPGHRIIVLDGYVKKRTRIPATIMARIRKLQEETEIWRPRFSWTRIKGESDVKGGGGHGWVEEGEGSCVGADGGSPEGERSRRRRRGGWRGGLGARAAVEREPETGRGVCGFCAASRWTRSRVKSG